MKPHKLILEIELLKTKLNEKGNELALEKYNAHNVTRLNMKLKQDIEQLQQQIQQLQQRILDLQNKPDRRKVLE